MSEQRNVAEQWFLHSQKTICLFNQTFCPPEKLERMGNVFSLGSHIFFSFNKRYATVWGKMD